MSVEGVNLNKPISSFGIQPLRPQQGEAKKKISDGQVLF